MSKCDDQVSIDKLRTLREKLCEQEKTWLDAACVEREKTVNELIELHGMFFSSNFDLSNCRDKLQGILGYLNIDTKTSRNS
jgi:hypothetical protein